MISGFIDCSWRSLRSSGSAGSTSTFWSPWRATSTVQVIPSSFTSTRETENFSSCAQAEAPARRNRTAAQARIILNPYERRGEAVLSLFEDDDQADHRGGEEQVREQVAPDDGDLVPVLEAAEAVGEEAEREPVRAGSPVLHGMLLQD